MAEVSILMPVFNSDRYLEDSLRSVLAQDLQNWRLIVVDDGSTDGSWELLRSYARSDKRLMLLRNEANHGLGYSLQRGLTEVRTPLCARFDSDDIADSNWLSTRVRQIRSSESLVLVSGSRTEIDETGRIVRRLDQELSPAEADWALKFGNPINHPSCLFRTQAAHDVGGYPDTRYLEDWVLFSRLRTKGSIVQEPEQRFRYRLHSSSASQRNQVARAMEPVVLQQVGQLCAPENMRNEVAWALFRGRPSHIKCSGARKYALPILEQRFDRFCGSLKPNEITSSLIAWYIRDIRSVVRATNVGMGLALEYGLRAILKRPQALGRRTVREMILCIKDSLVLNIKK